MASVLVNWKSWAQVEHAANACSCEPAKQALSWSLPEFDLHSSANHCCILEEFAAAGLDTDPSPSQADWDQSCGGCMIASEAAVNDQCSTKPLPDGEIAADSACQADQRYMPAEVRNQQIEAGIPWSLLTVPQARP